jgi:hypothetical protein
MREYLNQVEPLVNPTPSTESAEWESLRAEFAESRKWVENYEPHPLHPGYRFYVPQLTCAKVLLAQDTPESLHRAADLLSELYDYYSSIHNTRYLIDVLILQSMTYDSRSDEMIALEKLIEKDKISCLLSEGLPETW